jgi:hypothetical protein
VQGFDISGGGEANIAIFRTWPMTAAGTKANFDRF